MKFKIIRTSDWEGDENYKDFQTLEELINFCEEVKYSVIITTRGLLCLEIYDDYRE